MSTVIVWLRLLVLLVSTPLMERLVLAVIALQVGIRQVML